MNDKHIISLPTTLTYLKLRSIKGIKGESFKYLPSSITDLTLNSLESLENEGIKNLPPNIQDLELGYNSNLTDKCLNCVPTTLISLKVIGCSISNEAIKKFKNKIKCY